MYSVIIPTLWKCDRLKETLTELDSHPLVGEILLFDNTTNEIPITNLPKLKHILEGRNTYVTSPWNKGALMAQYNKLLVLNDDNWIDWNILYSLSDFITEEVGLIGMDEKNHHMTETNYEIGLEPIEHRNGGYGCVLFVHKNSWIPIPEEMKIWGQDDWLFVKNRNYGKQNYKLVNFKVNGSVSLTVDSLSNDAEINQIKQNDLLLKEKYKLF
jgi:hypothetical protein